MTPKIIALVCLHFIGVDIKTQKNPKHQKSETAGSTTTTTTTTSSSNTTIFFKYFEFPCTKPVSSSQFAREFHGCRWLKAVIQCQHRRELSVVIPIRVKKSTISGLFS
jgi:hypothetical protein